MPLPSGTDLGPAVLLIREHRPKNPKVHKTWGPPGGKTDKTDHSVLHAALREFGEEVGADWRNLANGTGSFQIVRLRSSPGANEAWMMLTDLDAIAAERALFGQDRSSWNLYTRMNTPLTNETSGYAFVPLDALLNADRAGRFRLGSHTETLRTPGHTLAEAKLIQRML